MKGPRVAGASESGPRLAAPSRLRLALSALLLLQLAGAFAPGPLLWGVHHLAYAPLPARLLVPLLGLFVLWTPLAERLGRLLAGPVERVLLGRAWIAYVLVPLAGAALFRLIGTGVHALGDGWLLGEMVARGHGFHGFDWISYYMHAKLYQLLGLQGEPAAFELFAALSVVAGALYLAVAAWGARTLTQAPGARILLYSLLVLSAPVQLFLGYAEAYAFLLVAMLLFLVAFAGHYQGRLPLMAPAAAFAAGVFLHLDALFLAPLLAAAVLWPPRPAAGAPGLPRRLLEAGAPVFVGLGLALVIHLLEGYGSADFTRDFFTRRPDRPLFMPLSGSPGLLSAVHVKDWLNLLLLLAPVPLALLAVLAASPRAAAPSETAASPRAAAPSDGDNRGAWLLCLACGWIGLLTFTIQMVLGVPRDWDLFAAQAPLFAVTAWWLWTAQGRRVPAPRVVGMIAAAALIVTAPWFWLNRTEGPALARLAQALDGQSAYAQAYAHEEIGKYHRKHGRHDLAIAEYRRMTELFPSNPRFHALLGALLYNTGDKAGAFTAFQRTIALDGDYPLGVEMMARLHAERREFDRAWPYAQRLAALGQESADAAELRGRVAEELGRPAEAIEAYERALASDPRRLALLERVGPLGLLGGDAAASERAYRRLLQADPQSLPARRGLVLALWGPLRERPDRWAAPEARARLEEALRIVAGLAREQPADTQVQAWQAEIAAALAGG